jgi:hypothetical protein
MYMKISVWLLGGSLSRTRVQDTIAMWVNDKEMGITTQTSEKLSIIEFPGEWG